MSCTLRWEVTMRSNRVSWVRSKTRSLHCWQPVALTLASKVSSTLSTVVHSDARNVVTVASGRPENAGCQWAECELPTKAIWRSPVPKVHDGVSRYGGVSKQRFANVGARSLAADAGGRTGVADGLSSQASG